MQMTNEAANFFGQKGYKLTQKEAYGFIGNFPVRVTFAKNLVQVIFQIDPADSRRLKKPLARALKDAGFGAQQILEQNYYAISISTKRADIAERYATLERTLLTAFQENQIFPMDNCPICGRSGCESATQHGAGYRMAHRDCLVTAQESAREKAEENQFSGNYALGFLGGLLGGIVGCIPNILTIWFTERIYAVLYALIPLGIYYGYKLFKGRLNRVTLIYTIVLSVVLAIVTDLTVVAIGLLAEGYELAVMGMLIGDPEFWSAMSSDILLSLVFVALGIGFSWTRITRTAHSDAEGMAASLETVQPIPGNMQAPTMEMQPVAPVYPQPAAEGAYSPQESSPGQEIR